MEHWQRVGLFAHPSFSNLNSSDQQVGVNSVEVLDHDVLLGVLPSVRSKSQN